MFKNRTNRKPTDDLYAAFKHNFPEVGPGTFSASSSSGTSDKSANAVAGPTLGRSEAPAAHDLEKLSALNTPRGSNEPWRFTPSIFDANPFSFTPMSNQPGFYTPGGMNTVYHNQSAGDLHTPGLAFHLGTPLSMPLPDGALHAAPTFDIPGLHPHIFHQNTFEPTHLFPEQTFPPSMLVHKDSGYEAASESPENADGTPEMRKDSYTVPDLGNSTTGVSALQLPMLEKFRYQITLNAPTAMIRSSDEIPVTYLNKGQAYTMSIIDSNPTLMPPSAARYRTTIRISFEDEQQRQRPSACWQLWKEGRGLAESHHRNGKLQAVEYVDPHPGAEDDPRRPRIELESASFDSFVVTWSPPITTGSSECSIAVRFNFLSTDFSHSKGVKGIPVRLCAKTQNISPTAPQSDGEVCFCKVKLFRDHGAERKLSNDIAHVKKSIDKLKQQISQAESGIKEFGKRKRTGSMIGKGIERPNKLAKHKRTWSVSSDNSIGRGSMEDDLHQKLATVQDMFTSTRPVSVLYLRGLEGDDPDLFPVSLPGEPEDLTKVTAIRRQSMDHSPSTSSLGSPVPTTKALSETRPGNMLSRSSTMRSLDWSSKVDSAFTIPSVPLKVQKVDDSMDWIQATGVDPSYEPLPEQRTRPAACFYVLGKNLSCGAADDCHRAVYVMERTLANFIRAVSSKLDMADSKVQRCIRMNPKGLKIVVDDDVVRELPEGQDMVVEFHDVKPGTVKDEEASVNTDRKQQAASEMVLHF